MMEASHGQRRIWAAEQSSSRGNAQIIPLAYLLEGPIDTDRLAHAISSVVAGHEALHTGLIFLNGRVFQRPSQRSFLLDIADFRRISDSQREHAIAEKSRAFFSERFDLAADLMLRALLILEPSARQLLLIAIHHSAGDGVSFELLQEQISRIYRGEATGVVLRDVRPFSAYVSHTRTRELAGEFEKALNEMTCQFAPEQEGVEPQPRSILSRPAHPRFMRLEINSHLHSSVVRLSKRHIGLGPAAIYFAALYVFLSAQLNQRRTAIGFPVSNRAGPGHENVVGVLTYIAPVPLDVAPSQSLQTCLAAAGEALFGLRRRFDLPYGLFLQRLHGDPFRFDTVPFEALLTYQPRKTSPLQFSGCKVSAAEPAIWPVPFELMLDIEEGDETASALFRWNAAYHSSATVEVLGEWFPWLLGQLCRQGDRSIYDVQRELRAPLERAAKASIARAMALRESRIEALLTIRKKETM